MNTQEKLLAALRMSNEAMKRLQKQAEKRAADVEALQAKTDEAVAALVKHERIFAAQSEKVAAVIGEPSVASHVATLELLRDTAKHRNAGELDEIGKPASQEKQARARTHGVTGAPTADYDETPHGRKFRERLAGGRG